MLLVLPAGGAGDDGTGDHLPLHSTSRTGKGNGMSVRVTQRCSPCPAEAQPAREREHQRLVDLQLAEIKRDTVRLSLATELWPEVLSARRAFVDASGEGLSRRRRMIDRAQERLPIMQRNQFVTRKWFARNQACRWCGLPCRWMIHDDQFRFIQIKHLAQLLRNLET